MKKRILIIFAALISFSTIAQHVDFIRGTWDEINAKAAFGNKYIYVDAYTEWCGWCKVMDKKTFTDPAVAEFMNKHFISTKIDFEDSLGIVLGMKFRVWAYPTSLVFNPQGQLVGKIAGYNQDNADFIRQLQAMLDIRKERVFAYDSRQLDLDYPEFYSNSFKKGNRSWPSDSAVTVYLKTQDDLFSEVNWSVILKFHPREYLEFVVENREKYIGNFGQEEVSEIIQYYIYGLMSSAARLNDQEKLEKAVRLCDYLEDPGSYRFFVLMSYYEKTKDWTAFANTLGERISDKGYENPGYINTYCWTIYENVDDKEILLQAVDWMKKVIEVQPNYFNVDTYAALLFKTGQYEEAMTYADKAIEIAKNDGEDPSGTKELKEKIKEAIK